MSLLQAYLKHSLIPGHALAKCFADKRLILDLGCGEGMLANFIARLAPQGRVMGIDLNARRIEIAQKNAQPNATFLQGDIFQLPQDVSADGAIFNDVLHHLSYARHAELLDLVLRQMQPKGVLVLKEVDQNDSIDRRWTTLFDRKLYPSDRLCFRTESEWLALLKRVGVRDVQVEHVRHPWPSSRTLFIARCPEGRATPIVPAVATSDSGGRLSADAPVNVFLTGATGFIGAHLARHLLRHGLGGRAVRLLLLRATRTGFQRICAAERSSRCWPNWTNFPVIGPP